MAPGYRNSNPSRRTARGAVDHDIFEGLPVRNWRRDIVTVAPPPALDLNQPKDKWDVELPWGMPKDAHLMPQHSQDLLRAARSGRIWQKRPLVEDEAEEDMLLPDKPEKKEQETKDDGFSVKTWKLVPKHMEGPEIEYLAKRRKGLKGTAVKGVQQGPTLTKMTVRKTDDMGNSFVEQVIVPEGVAVEGEVIAQTVVADPASVGLGAEPQPVKRRPPPPKRKAKGPGRGRKKKILAPTSAPAEGGAVVATPATFDGTAVVPDGMKAETNATPTNEDTEMGDGSQAASDDDDEEGSEDEDHEEGEIVESPADESKSDVKMSHAPPHQHQSAVPIDFPTEHKLPPRPTFSGFPSDTSTSSFPGHRGSQSRDMAGSPLKNTFTPRSYSPSVYNGEAEAEGDVEEQPQPAEETEQEAEKSGAATPTSPEKPQQGELQHHDEILPNAAETVGEAHQATEHADQTEAAATAAGDGVEGMMDSPPGGSEMLLDGDDGEQVVVVGEEAVASVPAEFTEEAPRIDEALTTEEAPKTEETPKTEEAPKVEEATVEPAGAADEVQSEEQPNSTEGKVGTPQDNFEDLLGGLEENLNEHEAVASANLLSRSNSVPDAEEGATG